MARGAAVSLTVDPLPNALDRRFEAIVFDWDGTAVADRRADTERLRRVIEALCGLSMDLYVVTGTHIENVDGQLSARPSGPGHLYFCVNRGSEVFRAGEQGLELVERRRATAEEEAALDAAAGATVAGLAARGLQARVVSQRLNRRKIDLIPEPEWADPPKVRIGDLLLAVEQRLREAGIEGLPEAVEIAKQAARETGLEEARVTSDAKHVEIGLTDKADAAGWVFDNLWRRGVSARLVLVAGDEFGALGGLPGSDSLLIRPEHAAVTVVSVGPEPTGSPRGVVHAGGGPAAFVALLEDQLARRECGDVPDIGGDDGWTLTVDGIDSELERVREALLVLADGRFGTNGSPVWPHGAASPRVLAGDVYDGEGASTALLPAPVWHVLAAELPKDARLRRRLDLRIGVTQQTIRTGEGDAVAIMFSSLARPGAVALRVAGPSALTNGGTAVRPTGGTTEAGEESGVAYAVVPASTGGVAAAAGNMTTRGGVERLGAYLSDPAERPAVGTALRAAAEIRGLGFERLLGEHRRAWAGRWEDADVVIRDDEELQLRVRFALFHLMSSVATAGEAAVGAKGLTGEGYRGHVFWDTDVFVLPFLAATHPPAARAILEYRIRRLPAALRAARAIGVAGARFPWESARDGTDVTPSSARDPAGQVVRIRTGEIEEHVVADVAWAAACYVDWTGDVVFERGPGLDLFVQTARYWASRVRFDRDGKAHILRRHRTGRVPRAGRRQCLYERHGAVEPAAGCRRGRPRCGQRVRERAHPLARHRGRPRRRLRPLDTPVRAVRRLLRPGAPCDRRSRTPAADRSRSPPRP